MKESLMVIVLALIIIIIGILGVVWDQHLTLGAQDRTIEMLQSIKCKGEIQI